MVPTSVDVKASLSGETATTSFSLTVDVTDNEVDPVDPVDPVDGEAGNAVAAYAWSSHEVLDDLMKEDHSAHKPSLNTVTSSAVDHSDALLTLKMALGRETEEEVFSPYQYLAADMNQDGRVTGLDALKILKMSNETEAQPEWRFVAENTDLYDQANGDFTIGPKGIDWDVISQGVSSAGAGEVFIGVIAGDVNDSWSSGFDLPGVSNDHLASLVGAGLGSHAQWALEEAAQIQGQISL